MTFPRRFVGVVVAALVVSCGGGAPGGGAARVEAPASGARTLRPLARQVYEAAREAASSSDLAGMAAHLERAVAIQADFTEAWYNLGACRANLAQEAAVAYRDLEAVELFRAAVDAKRQARALMDRGVWYVYLSPGEQRQVRSDVEHALEDADEVLADQASLLAALRLSAR